MNEVRKVCFPEDKWIHNDDVLVIWENNKGLRRYCVSTITSRIDGSVVYAVYDHNLDFGGVFETFEEANERAKKLAELSSHATRSVDW